MRDLIDRKAALKALREIYIRGNGLRPATVDMINAIKFLPSAEPKKGKWTNAYDGNDGHVKCTICFKTYDYITQAQYFNYCPHCGALMEVTE